MKNMTELKLRRLFRGYVLTDFDGNEVGCKDSGQVMEEIKNLLKLDEKFEQPVTYKMEEYCIRKQRSSTIERHRNIFEKAREQINLTGKVNNAKIARDLNITPSNVGNHLKKMNVELDELIKKWQEERDKKMLIVETRTDEESNKLPE